MTGNTNLNAAKSAKNDEFYTQYSDIEAEINAYVEYNPDVFRDKTILCPCDDPEWLNFTKYFAENFERFGLRKLISTSYAHTHGKLLTMTRDKNGFGYVDADGIEVSGYLKGNGDFRSKEVTTLRDEADVIITNPPFSLFREFLAWIMAADKQFVIVGNMNAITYKEIFPLLKDGTMWIGYKCFSGGMDMIQPASTFDEKKTKSYRIDEAGNIIKNIMGVIWFTNLDHGKRHQPLLLDTMAHNLKFNKKLRKKLEKDYGKVEYPHYDNYDAIEVPFVEAIPSDYDGVMGVPITFLDKYNPEQFEIVGLDRYTVPKEFLVGGRVAIGGKPTYARILIRSKKGDNR